MLFLKCGKLPAFPCCQPMGQLTVSQAGQFEMRLDREDPETLGRLLSYLRADLLPTLATLEEASRALKISLRYDVSSTKPTPSQRSLPHSTRLNTSNAE